MLALNYKYMNEFDEAMERIHKFRKERDWTKYELKDSILVSSIGLRKGSGKVVLLRLDTKLRTVT